MKEQEEDVEVTVTITNKPKVKKESKETQSTGPQLLTETMPSPLDA